MGLLQRLARSNGDWERKVEANTLIKDRLDKNVVRTRLEDMKMEIEYKRAVRVIKNGGR